MQLDAKSLEMKDLIDQCNRNEKNNEERFQNYEFQIK